MDAQIPRKMKEGVYSYDKGIVTKHGPEGQNRFKTFSRYKQNTRVRGPVILFVSIMPMADKKASRRLIAYVNNANGLGAWSRPLKDSVSGSSYESIDTPDIPVGGSKMHMAYPFWLLVPGLNQ